MGEQDLRFTETHEWARLEDGLVTVGLSAYALEQLGEVVYLELPDPGDELAQSATFGVVESVKAASDVYAPISGTVVDVNTDLIENLDRISADPYGDGWLIKIEPADESELEGLMGPEEYDRFCQSEDEDEDEDDEDFDEDEMEYDEDDEDEDEDEDEDFDEDDDY
mgnify:CR=1 FL=1